MTSKIFDTISSARIFSSADREKLYNVLSECKVEIKDYKKGETIYSLSEYRLAIGIILKGNAKVVKDNGVVISILKEKEIFGCASLFASNEGYVNNIIASRECRVVFIDKDTIERIMREDNNFSVAFIAYLSDRLYYLNSRIVSFTAGSADSRLATYLYNYFTKNSCSEISVCSSQLAFSLDIGRASLYRAFDSLCEKGAIKKDGKTVTLANETKLKRLMS